MRIDTVAHQQDRAGRYAVHFHDGSVMRLYRQTVEDFGLYPGMELTEQEMSSLREAAGAMSAKMRAVRIVAATNVSERDLEQRLVRKGEDPVQAKQAVQWMTQMQLVDDRKTAEQIVSRCIHKGYGLARAKQVLYEKRIPKAYWEEALEDYPDQTQAIVSFLRTKLGENWDDRQLHRAMDALVRKGHSYSQIRKGLALMAVDMEDFPEE